MENWRQAVEDEARTWKGTPFHHKGRVKGVGVDCGGYLHCVYSQFFPLPEFPREYASDWAVHSENEIYLDWIAPFVVEVKAPVQGGLTLAR